MRPKEFYDKNPIQEVGRYVFALFPDVLKERYIQFIQDPIRQIEDGEGEYIQCESYLDFPDGHDVMQEIWRCMQKASIIIADITGLNPNVMYELGVALMKKENVLIIAEEGTQPEKKIPFDLSHLRVRFYQADKLDELKQAATRFIREKVRGSDKPTFKEPKTEQLMTEAKNNREQGNIDTTIVLFEKMSEEEPENWYIALEWGITLKQRNFQDALDKFREALELAFSTGQKAKINLEIAKLYQEHDRLKEALSFYEKSEALDNGNDQLYVDWADLLAQMSRFEQAMAKMQKALAVKNTKENSQKLLYYTLKYTAPSNSISFEKWLLTQQPPTRGMGHTGTDTGGIRGRGPRVTFTNFMKGHPIGTKIQAVITKNHSRHGLFVETQHGFKGLIFRRYLPGGNFHYDNDYDPGKEVSVEIIDYKVAEQKIGFKLAS